MSLVLHYHPLASFCWKPLIALYENDTAFEPVMVDLGNPESRAAFEKVWPMAKFPVPVGTDRGATIAETTTIVEYLDTFHPGPVRLLPADQDGAWQARMWDRVFDHYLQEPMQKIVGDRLRPDGGHDLQGVEQALGGLRQAYAMLEPLLVGRDWFLDEFSRSTARRHLRSSMPMPCCRLRLRRPTFSAISTALRSGRPSRACWKKPNPISTIFRSTGSQVARRRWVSRDCIVSADVRPDERINGQGVWYPSPGRKLSSIRSMIGEKTGFSSTGKVIQKLFRIAPPWEKIYFS